MLKGRVHIYQILYFRTMPAFSPRRSHFFCAWCEIVRIWKKLTNYHRDEWRQFFPSRAARKLRMLFSCAYLWVFAGLCTHVCVCICVRACMHARACVRDSQLPDNPKHDRILSFPRFFTSPSSWSANSCAIVTLILYRTCDWQYTADIRHQAAHVYLSSRMS